MRKLKSNRNKGRGGSTFRRRRSSFNRPPKNLRYQHAYEEVFILRDIEELGGSASAAELRLRFPGRYTRHLGATLKRMAKAGYVVSRNRSGAFARGQRAIYWLPRTWAEEVNAA